MSCWIRIENTKMDPSFKNGLVEINPSTDGQNNVWYDAYILDVQPLSTPCSEINVQITGNIDGDDGSVNDDGKNQSLMATIVMAIKDEPVSVTITEKKHCHQLPMNQIRFKPNSPQTEGKFFTKMIFIQIS